VRHCGIAISDGHIATTPDGRWVWSIGGMFNNGIKSNILEENFLIFIFSTTNLHGFTWY